MEPNGLRNSVPVCNLVPPLDNFCRYVIRGGMQDFNYIFSNCVELTIEISCCKYPPVSALTEEWQNNRGQSYFHTNLNEATILCIL